MKVLHTSDWHFGKLLDGNSRLEEQEQFIEELCEICEREQIDLILLSGDVYDTGNPSAKAEKLFFQGVKKLTKGGRRPMIVIAGNHDSPERLSAPDVLAYEHGIIMLGLPKSVALAGKYEEYEIVRSGAGFLELEVGGEHAVILTMPYPSEKRLQELIETMETEEENQLLYSQKIGALFRELEKEFREDTINIAMGHFYTMGGEESASERPIQLGGAFSVNGADLPQKAQYIALGHLHKPQLVPNTNHRCYYSGSPIAYSKSEAGYSKQVNVITIEAGKEAMVKTVPLTAYKPIEIWHTKSVEEALALCQEKQKENCWVYLEIETKEVLTQQEVKAMKTTKEDIIEIIPILQKKEAVFLVEEAGKERSLEEEFIAFYQESQNELQPTQEMITLFLELLQEEEDA